MVPPVWASPEPEYDFHIVFLPRSGSHMLVSALNSHPMLDVSHIDHGHHGKGPIKGHCSTLAQYEKAPKCIFLMRDSYNVCLSRKTTLPTKQDIGAHTLEPVVIEPPRQVITEEMVARQDQRRDELLEKAMRYDKLLIVEYESLTGNKDIRQIPKHWAKVLCDFLEVETCELSTPFYKPEIKKYG